jgi:hypothetical protein
MRRNVMFERNRNFRPEDDRARPVHLGPRSGAAIGEYATPEPNEYSDDYFGPPNDYEGRGFSDDFNPPRMGSMPSAGIVIHGRHVRPTSIPTDSGHYGELHEGSQSWATLKHHLDRSTQSGGHRGRGPKGYERSDERIREEVCEMLTDDHDIDASEISVDVNQGEVTLTGTVPDRRIKFLVEDRVAQCAGVKDVHNKLHSTRPT